jgi:hypothetical protein
MQHKLLHPHRLYSLFKLCVYAALFINVWLFLRGDLGAAGVRDGTSAGLLDTIEIYARTIDTAAWLVLLLLFELETSFLPDATLHSRRVKWTIHGARALCALVIVNSLIGYSGKFATYLDARPFAGDACALVGGDWQVLGGLDEFAPLDAGGCAELAPGTLRLSNAPVLATPLVLAEAQHLALADVVNAAAWIMVVLLLEFDVRLQLRGGLRGWTLWASALLKFLTYAVLLAAALYWGFAGTFLDFWDAFLWLVAFVFIELNLFTWQEETQRAAERTVIKVG